MKLIGALIAVLIVASANAAGPTRLTGRNDSGESIVFVPSEVEPTYRQISVRYNDGRTEVLNGQQCAFSEDSFSFACAKKDGSLFSAVTYRHVIDLATVKERMFSNDLSRMEYGSILACTQGCSGQVPRELYLHPDEAYDSSEECANGVDISVDPVRVNLSSGTAKAENVRLRDNPHSDSRVLRTMQRGAKIKVLELGSTCLLLDHKPGMWVFVRVSDGQAPSEGWIYDGHVEYDKR